MVGNKVIADAIEDARRSGTQIALATVVRVTGSAYRREGAKMLVDKNKNTLGVISGGCLEQDVTEVAQQAMEEGRPVLKQYVLDEDLVWGLGLGCPGTVEVYIEPLTFAEITENDQGTKSISSPLDAWITCLKQEQMGVLSTILKAPSELHISLGSRLFIPEHGDPIGSLDHDELNRKVLELAREKFKSLNPKSETCSVRLSSGESIDIFLDVNVSPTELIIFGAGHDAIPLSSFSLQLGFKTTVVDPRPAYATHERFPRANIILADSGSLQERVHIGSRTYVVIMNHHLERDRACLSFALNFNTPYIGVLGPRSRCMKLLENVDQFVHVYNPVGLDIGAESSEEVAISILAEILAIRNNCSGGFLHGRLKIHDPT
ncbi:XdhC family protein [Thermoflavimicrobium dichotomicum]|uniref:Xanthine and CO dehydrogenase maturation factor, XdhC/CoxF family n=1 Tax=Thermoflavimicrobium dichotomicum TaxID=46223 RepID=A0A1I3QAL0_9BACL|nr:XdhC/CoxI family protein [Thermoflavimicrobium dichotomicum]SFJ30146.1 Xanthine and CO dehydrogenase maturation factor, XdhC/CoxF family [Thermoflavimicrobium dichotomicum]